jgi:hypothetical protein
MSSARTLSQADLLAESKERFGDDWLNWAFTCPNCGDTATGRDFTVALTNYPRKGPGDNDVQAHHILGQECIGRTLGALSGPPTGDQGRSRAERGCDWTAYGLIHGPWEVTLPEGGSVWCFPLADAPAPAEVRA